VLDDQPHHVEQKNPGQIDQNRPANQGVAFHLPSHLTGH
jgi:hypothetical protein